MQGMDTMSETNAPAMNMNTQQPSMQIGGATQYQDMNKKEETPKKTQADYDNELYGYESELNQLQEDYEKILGDNKNWDIGMNNILGKYLGDQKGYKDWNIMKDSNFKSLQRAWESLNKFSKHGEYKDLARNRIEEQMQDLRNKSQQIRDNKDYDPRSDDQKREDKLISDMRDREDTAYQRSKEDMTKAGLNPGLMFGSAGGAGASIGSSGGASSKRDKEEKERKERKQRKKDTTTDNMRLFSNLITMLGMGGMNMATKGIGSAAAAAAPAIINQAANMTTQKSNPNKKLIRMEDIKVGKNESFSDYLKQFTDEQLEKIDSDTLIKWYEYGLMNAHEV